MDPEIIRSLTMCIASLVLGAALIALTVFAMGRRP